MENKYIYLTIFTVVILTWLNVGTYFIGRYLGFFGGKKSKKSRA